MGYKIWYCNILENPYPAAGPVLPHTAFRSSSTRLNSSNEVFFSLHSVFPNLLILPLAIAVSFGKDPAGCCYNWYSVSIIFTIFSRSCITSKPLTHQSRIFLYILFLWGISSHHSLEGYLPAVYSVLVPFSIRALISSILASQYVRGGFCRL